MLLFIHFSYLRDAKPCILSVRSIWSDSDFREQTHNFPLKEPKKSTFKSRCEGPNFFRLIFKRRTQLLRICMGGYKKQEASGPHWSGRHDFFFLTGASKKAYFVGGRGQPPKMRQRMTRTVAYVPGDATLKWALLGWGVTQDFSCTNQVSRMDSQLLKVTQRVSKLMHAISHGFCVCRVHS